MSHKIILAALLISTLLAATALACLWDTDTLQMERLRFPGVLEIITGKFVRHSRAYYEWRITDRQKKLATNPGDPALIDDVAVAYAKLGRPAEGIPLLEQVLQQHPDRYETLSNLGTLLFFAGRLDESKHYIRCALEINPSAHFGRERYQLLLTEYLQQSQRDEFGVMSVASREPGEIGPIIPGFANFLIREKFGGQIRWSEKNEWKDRLKEFRNAAKGVLGMMHFANFESPVLLETLGDLLLAGAIEDDAAQLATRAYLRAAEFSSDQMVAGRFREMAKQSLAMYIPEQNRFVRIESELGGDVADAKVWYAEIE